MVKTVKYLGFIIGAVLSLLSLWISAEAVLAQDRAVTVTIRVRDEQGNPIVGEAVSLLQQPDGNTVQPDCQTDEAGLCVWHVSRGLYALAFSSIQIDSISALATAEGGLSGLGVTVGDGDITYNFVVANGNNLYFDQAPDSSVPDPFIPTLADVIHTPNTTTISATVEEATPVVTSADSPSNPVTPIEEPGYWWPRIRFILVVGGALVLGWIMFVIQQRRQKALEQQQSIPDLIVTDKPAPVIVPVWGDEPGEPQS